MEQLHPYGPHLTRVRLDAAGRLGKEELRTVAGAARYLNIGKSTLHHYEDGTKRPSLEMLEHMANHYGVMAGDMLPSKAIRSGEVAGIVAPLMQIPVYAREMFIRQMAAFASALAATIESAAHERMGTQETLEQAEAYNLQPSTKFIGKPPGTHSTERLASGSDDVGLGRHGSATQEIGPHEHISSKTRTGVRSMPALRDGAGRPDTPEAPKRRGSKR